MSPTFALSPDHSTIGAEYTRPITCSGRELGFNQSSTSASACLYTTQLTDQIPKPIPNSNPKQSSRNSFDAGESLRFTFLREDDLFVEEGRFLGVVRFLDDERREDARAAVDFFREEDFRFELLRLSSPLATFPSQV